MNTGPLALLILLAGSAACGAGPVEPKLLLESGHLVVQQGDRFLRGERLQGATLTLRIGAERAAVKVDLVQPDPQDRSGEVMLYTLTFPATGHPVCTPDAEGKTDAVALPGVWSPSGDRLSPAGITLACTSGAMAKCVRWGYKPWSPDQNMVDLYAACTRAVTADYCGNGEGHTRDGTAIEIYDDTGVQQRAAAAELPAGFEFEAGFSPRGAVCVRRPRLGGETLGNVTAACPQVADLHCDEELARRKGALVLIRSGALR